MLNYALCLLERKGVSVDVAGAATYFEIASREGYAGVSGLLGFVRIKIGVFSEMF
jgi:hypothetical protein